MTTVTILFAFCVIGSTLARSDAELRKWFIQQAFECSKEHPVTGEELQMMKDHKIPNNKNAKCIVACLFKKIGWMDEKGMFNEENAYKTSEKEYPGDTAKLESAQKLYATCKKVNEEVTDDEEGCERASVLATCFLEQAPKMGFMLQ